MDKTFDFNTIGKRMPYAVPDGFFEKMEEDVMQDIKAENDRERPYEQGRRHEYIQTSLAS